MRKELAVKSTNLVAISELRTELAEISTAEEALDVRSKAEKMRDAYKLMNKSVAECNEFGEIYLLATWKFGELVKPITAGGQEGNQNAAN